MNRISAITKRDILDLFRNGIDIPNYWETQRVTYNYVGRMEEIEFLNRLYDLRKMGSLDSMFSSAEREIWQHTVNNNDYPSCWVFIDERFQLKNGSDEVYLKFMCEIFHPEVRCEKGSWKEFLDEINRLLRHDGYELYPAKKISNRDVYEWRIYQEENMIFIPYSQRNAQAIKEERIKFSITSKARNQIYQLLERYNEVYRETSETGWQYDVTTSEEVFNDIRQFYPPKCYNQQGEYVETRSLQEFLCHNSPYYVLDAIEFFQKYNRTNDFEIRINTLFKLNNIPLKLTNGTIVNAFDSLIKIATLASIGEVGLKELLQESTQYHDEGNIKIAIEKLWDAFERLKTYYSPAFDKKESVNKLTSAMSSNQTAYKELFDKEFRDLTVIGNNFRIRHHEKTKTEIEDNRHYEYFYKRCLSLISVAIQYLDNGRMG